MLSQNNLVCRLNSFICSAGFIDEPMLRDHMPAPSADSVILMCGPPPMIKFACIPNLEKLGFTAEQFISF